MAADGAQGVCGDGGGGAVVDYQGGAGGFGLWVGAGAADESGHVACVEGCIGGYFDLREGAGVGAWGCEEGLGLGLG